MADQVLREDVWTAILKRLPLGALGLAACTSGQLRLIASHEEQWLGRCCALPVGAGGPVPRPASFARVHRQALGLADSRALCQALVPILSV